MAIVRQLDSVRRRRSIGLGDTSTATALPAGLEYSTLPGHEGDVVNPTSATITWNSINYPPGYGTEAWWGTSTENVDQDDPSIVGTTAWAWVQNHGQDAAKLADLQQWTKNSDGTYTPIAGSIVDPSRSPWNPGVYGATLEILQLGAQPYSADLAANWNTLTAAIWAKYGFHDWAAVSSGDPDATAKWIQAAQDTAAQQATSTAPARYLIDGLEVDASGNPVPGGYNALADLIQQQEASGTTPGVWSPQMINLVNQNPALWDALPDSVKATYQRTGFSITQTGDVTPAANIQPAAGQTAATPYGMPAAGGGGGVPAPDSSPSPAPTAGGAAAPGGIPKVALIAGAIGLGALLLSRGRR